jgi:Insertion element 4 transposase N-terminal/Transposase DDE domain
LSDVVSVGLLLRVFPPGLVDEVIAEVGRTEQRQRVLPARTMAYFAIGMALDGDASYEDVMELLTDGLAWSSEGAEEYVLPSKSAIFQARLRLGFEPVEGLFRRVARPLATAETPEAWLAGRRVVALDGTCLDVADTELNAEFFGRAGVGKGERSAFPQARVVGLTECSTHAILDAEVGPYKIGENTLAGPVVDRLQPGMLVLADRGFAGFSMWQRAAATGADLLWRVRTGKTALVPRLVRELPDGSYLAEIRPSGPAFADQQPSTVRVIDYTLQGSGDDQDSLESYRLFSTILDPEEASAEQLALAYGQRWEIENAFDELKTHQRGPRKVLRSKSPDLVFQEIWGHLCCHYAIRTLMADTAAGGGHDPPRLLHRRAQDQPPLHRPAPGRFFPLSTLKRCGGEPSTGCSAGSTRNAASAPTLASSNATEPASTSNDPIISAGHNPPGHPGRSFFTLTERY